MSDFEMITVNVADAVATLTLNRPDRLNAAPPAMFDEIRGAIDRLPGLGARALILTGAGHAFCSGADLAAEGRAAATAGGTASRNALRSAYNPTLLALADLDMPVISAVTGPAAGIGCSLALSADFTIAGESAYFLQAFVNIGLIPDGGSTWLLPRLIGVPRAMQMMMLGEKISGAQAADWGMIYKCVADDAVLAEAQALAQRLAAGPTRALGVMRRLVRQGLTQGYAEAMDQEAKGQFIAGNTSDAVEGVVAFMQKRKANFTGA